MRSTSCASSKHSVQGAQLRDRLDRFLEAVDVDRVVALVNAPGDVPDEAHADLLGDARPRGLGDHIGSPAVHVHLSPNLLGVPGIEAAEVVAVLHSLALRRAFSRVEGGAYP